VHENNNSNQSTHLFNRRDFVKLSTATMGAAFVGMQLAGCASTNRKIGAAPEHPFVSKPLEKVRIGYVGVGGMGSAHVRNLLKIDKAEIKAVCDIVPEKVERIQQWTMEAGQSKPTGYSRGNYDFIRMCETEELDLVYTATPWEWHVPVCLAAMKNGKHAATEVPAALTIDECWQLVETAEKLKKHCLMMENCCYDRPELLILNLVRKGLLGEIIHGECGYLHDLRALKFSSEGEGLWRIAHSIKRNANLYPTHGLGPVAQCMNINRGDLFDYLVSMSSPSRGLNLFAAENFGADDPRARQKYALGDVNISLIKTKNGKTITVWHECDTPRPYSRNILVQGTKGLARRWPEEVYIEGRSQPHHWDKMEDCYQEFEHPLWKKLNQAAAGAGHGGMDFIEDYRLIQCLLEGTATDFDVYDAAAWSVVTELSERSVANRSKPIDFPDFTRGKWKTNKPVGIIAEGEVSG